MKTIRLSDDELVAIAVRSGGRWMGSLPTIDDSDMFDLLRAASRGERSFVLREDRFSAIDGDPVSLEEMRNFVEPAVSETPAILGYAALASEPSQAVGLSFAIFRIGDANSRLLAMTAPEGITEVSRIPVEEAETVIRSFIASAISTTEQRVVAVLVAPESTDVGKTLVVGAESVVPGTYSRDGADLTSGEPFEEVPRDFLALI